MSMLTLAATPWQPFKSVQEQSLINEPGFSLATHPVKAQYVHAYSEAGHREVRDSFVKKGSSRTGARRVRNLSAAQLDRKRAHDREAQRMIRQRRKDHIDSLERTMSALRHSNQANISMMEKIQRQNWQLEEENAHLRRELGDANHQRNLQPHKYPRSYEAHITPSRPTSAKTLEAPVDIPLSELGPGCRVLSLMNSPSLLSRAGPRQQHQNDFSTPTYNTSNGVAPSGAALGELTIWRPHDSTASMHLTASTVQLSQEISQPSKPFATSNPSERAQWATWMQSFTLDDQLRQKPFEVPPRFQSAQNYLQPGVQVYPAIPSPLRAHTYPPGPVPPQAEIHAMHFSSPTVCQQPLQPPFCQPLQYAMQPMQSVAGHLMYSAQQSSTQAPPAVPPTAYSTCAASQQLSPQQMDQSMHTRHDREAKGSSITRYHCG